MSVNNDCNHEPLDLRNLMEYLHFNAKHDVGLSAVAVLGEASLTVLAPMYVYKYCSRKIILCITDGICKKLNANLNEPIYLDVCLHLNLFKS